jgi:hypothetical protein
MVAHRLVNAQPFVIDFGFDRVALFLADAPHIIPDGVHEVVAS